MKKILYIAMASSLLFSANITRAQEKDPAKMESIVEAKNYIFKAETVLPQQGSFRQLTPEFDLIVTGDSVISYLPYFGRTYTAPVNPAAGGIKFTSTKFDYKSKKKNSDKWEISIVPKDAGSVQQLYLTIFDNGTASLRVNDRNRQTISFNGYIIEGREKPKKAF